MRTFPVSPVLWASVLSLLCACGPDSGGGGTGGTSGNGGECDTASATVDIGDACDLVDDATIALLTGADVQKQSEEQWGGARVCIWSTRNPNTQSENGSVEIVAYPRTGCDDGDLTAGYELLAGASPAPTTALHPVPIDGADDSYLLFYERSDRTEFTGEALANQTDIVVSYGFTREADKAAAPAILTQILQAAVDNAR